MARLTSKRIAYGVYEVTTDMGTFRISSYEMPASEAGGYRPGTYWQITLDDEWLGTDPLDTKAQALETISWFLRRERM